MKQIHETAKIYEPVVILDTDVIIEKDCRIGQFTFIAARNFRMCEGAQISPQATVGGGGDVTMDKFSVLGFGARLIPATDTLKGKYMCDSKPESERAIIRGSIHIGEGTYIGSNAVVCVSEKYPGIHIGRFSVIGAGTYIDRSLTAYTVIHPFPFYKEELRANVWA